MRTVGLAALLLVGCGEGSDDPEASGFVAADFAPSAGLRMEFVPPDHGEAPALQLHVTETEWILREGDDWETAAPVATWSWSLDNGLVVDGGLLLPGSFQAGSSFDNGTVGQPADREVWYGTFPAALPVQLTQAVFSGELVFAEGVGPIAFTLGSSPWELAGYSK